MTCFMAVWRRGAYRNPMPTWSMHCPTLAGVRSRLTPRVSTTSADPQRLETERLPCLATFSPAPATTSAVAVDTLNVADASPPGPAGVDQHLAVGAGQRRLHAPRPDPYRLQAHDLGQPDQLLHGFAFHAQGREERRDLDGGPGRGWLLRTSGPPWRPPPPQRRQVAPIDQRTDGVDDHGGAHEVVPSLQGMRAQPHEKNACPCDAREPVEDRLPRTGRTRHRAARLQAGLMFWFTRKRLPGSTAFLIAASRG
jgi:hypothetical protein